MSQHEMIESIGKFLGWAAAGGAGVIALLAWPVKIWVERSMEKVKAEHTKWLDEHKSQLTRDVESLKMKLAKSQFMFEKEYEALSALLTLQQELLPPHSHPDMNWYDACDEIARDFTDIERNIENYLIKHGAVLQKDIRDLLSEVIWLAGSNKFELLDNNAVPTTANRAADQLFDKLQEAAALIERNLKEQYDLRA